MANLRIPDHLRLHLMPADSPTSFPGIQEGLSPITDLAMNLSGASLGSTPQGRRLSMSSLDDTPTPARDRMDTGESNHSSGGNRLLKHTIKLSNSNGGHLSKTRGLSRRINLNIPASPLSCSTHNDKENMGCGNGGSSSGIVPEIETRPFSPHNSPSKQNISPSKYSTLKHTLSPIRQRQPLEDQDPNSQDSGYGIFSDREEARTGFQFMEPSGLAPRKFSIEQSPRKEISPLKSPRSKSGHSNPPLFHSLSSGSESIDDGFTDILDLEKLDETENLPSGISSLLSGPIIKGHNILGHNSPKEERQRKKPLFQRSQSLVENLTPSSSRARSCLFKSSSSSSGDAEDNIGLVELDSLRSFKRPEPPCEIGPLHPKRRKSSSLHIIRENLLLPNAPVLQRSFSETEATIKHALQRSTQIPDLIGDFTKPFVLPLMEGRHQDLKTISAETLADLMSGKFSEEVESFMIIDCRYPYEFDGGHIKGAKNIYTKEQMFKEFVEIKKPLENLQNKDPNENSESVVVNKRNILIFHCEFSSERGPNMFRFLRNSDRDQNKESYPLLNYPELYLLHGGYKSFFEKYSDKCEPCAYRPMLDPNHETDLRLFRSKSKSWNGDSKSRLALRSNLKRLGL